MSLLIAVVGTIAVLTAGFGVYWDARRTDVGKPRLWAGFVACSLGAGVALYLLVPSIPIPGLLVIVVLGPIFYLLERDDSVHGGDPADPTRLPNAGSDGQGEDESDV